MCVTDFNLVSVGQKKTSAVNSKQILVKKGNKYQISIEFVGKKGQQFCAYFGVIFLDENGKEMERKIRWINDFSGTKKRN